jgi:hypothetical protein
VRAGRKQFGNLRSDVKDLLEVVENQQETAVSERACQALCQGSLAAFPDSERLRDGRQDERRFTYWRQGNEQQTIVEFVFEATCNFQGEPSLTDATRTGQRNQPNLGLA